MRTTSMTGERLLVLNAGASLMDQTVHLLCGFVLSRYILVYYGSSVNGLVSSLTHFLGFISLLEFGIGPVIQANLYGPLARRDERRISEIVISAERFFRRIACIFLGYIVVIAVVYPILINTGFDPWYSVSLLVILAVSTFAEYFFGATYQLLLGADQRAYVQKSLQIFTVLLNTCLCVLLIRWGASIHLVKLLTAAVFVLRPLGVVLYVRRHYRLDKRLQLRDEPIRQKWNGFSQHIAAVICGHMDTVILSVCATMAAVSVYDVYYRIVAGIANVFLAVTANLNAYFGNILADPKGRSLSKSFEIMEYVIHMSVTIVSTIAAITIVPFVSVYTRGIADADYNQPLFGAILVMAYAARCLRTPYFVAVKAAGHFEQTQNGAWISVVINFVVSIASVSRFGLVGVAFGTLVAMLYQTCYYVWYLKRNILNRHMRYFIGHLLCDAIVCALIYILTHGLRMDSISYAGFCAYAAKVSIISAVVGIIGTAVFSLISIRWTGIRD